MHIWSDWLAVAILGAVVVVVPGPNFAIVARNTLLYSRRAGAWTAVGLTAGNSVHVAYCLVGIGLLISRSILLFNTLKWLGAAYLVYVGIQCLRAKPGTPTSDSAPAAPDVSPWRAFRSGLLTDLLNPKVTLFFLSLFTQVIRPETPHWLQAMYGATVLVIEMTWQGAVVLFLSREAVRRRFLSASHWLERAMGGVFVALGVRLAFAHATE